MAHQVTSIGLGSIPYAYKMFLKYGSQVIATEAMCDCDWSCLGLVFGFVGFG